MRKYQLASGKILEFNLAGVETALELHMAILNECKNAGFDLSLTSETQIIEVIGKNKEAILNIFSSKKVMEAVLACCTKVLYDRKHFSLELFEDETAKADFYGCMVIIGVENILPFFPYLRSFFEPIVNLFLKQ